MNNKEIIVKKILDSKIYKEKVSKKNVPFMIWLKGWAMALRFLPVIIIEVFKRG